MRKPLTVTLSVVCTLKGMSRQLIQKIKAMLQYTVLCIEYHILFVDTVDMKIKASNAFNAMFVDTGVCGSYTTPYAGVKTLHKVASRPRQEGRLLYCVSLPSWGFRCSPVSQSEEAALLTFLDLSNYKGDCRQDTQPIPNS